MEGNKVYLEGLSEGQAVRFYRLSKELRQIDLASRAHCEASHIVDLEKNRWVRPDIRESLLLALGLLEGTGDD